MERFDVGRDDRFDAMLAAVDRGKEAVPIRDGREVAQLVAMSARKGSLDLGKLADVDRAMAPLRDPTETGATLIRRMRDECDH